MRFNFFLYFYQKQWGQNNRNVCRGLASSLQMNRQNSPIPFMSLGGEYCNIPKLSTIALLFRYWNIAVLTLWSLLISGSVIEMHPYLMPSEHFDLVLVSPGVFLSLYWISMFVYNPFMEDCEVFLVASYLRQVEDRVELFQISFLILRDFCFVQSSEVTMGAEREERTGIVINNMYLIDLSNKLHTTYY